MKPLLAAFALVLVTGCGGGGSSFGSAREAAEAGGCDGIEDVSNADMTLMVTNAVTCQINGREVEVQWFNNDESLKNYRDIADGFGGNGVAYGDNWAVVCSEEQQDCDDFVAAVG